MQPKDNFFYHKKLITWIEKTPPVWRYDKYFKRIWLLQKTQILRKKEVYRKLFTKNYSTRFNYSSYFFPENPTFPSTFSSSPSIFTITPFPAIFLFKANNETAEESVKYV